MLVDHWPLFGLRLRTPRLELRLPSPDDLGRLADLAAEGVHQPHAMPFSVPWTDVAPAERARSVLQHFWGRLAGWTPQVWELSLTVFEDGQVVGQQSLSARAFAVLREVDTGSWLALRHHGRGIGTEMRTAILHLAFAGLGALEATSAAFVDNPASLRVSEKLGYEPDGLERHARRGTAATMRRLRLPRARWQPRDDVTLTGLEPCLPLFGLQRPDLTPPEPRSL